LPESDEETKGVGSAAYPTAVGAEATVVQHQGRGYDFRSAGRANAANARRSRPPVIVQIDFDKLQQKE